MANDKDVYNFLYPKIIFITGGTRSGKSGFAVELAKKITDRVVFVATCIPEDEEMMRRVALHKKARPADWKTVEGKADLSEAFEEIGNWAEVVIVDCLTLFVSGLMLQGFKEREIEEKIGWIVKCISEARYTTILVSNEVGSGVVPENKLARQFRDFAGMANQKIAAAADEVYLMAAGIAVKIKS